MNLRASYEREGWKLWLHALNLTNELEERVGYSAATPATPATPARRGRPGRPGYRSVRVADGFSIYGGIAYNF